MSDLEKELALNIGKDFSVFIKTMKTKYNNNLIMSAILSTTKVNLKTLNNMLKEISIKLPSDLVSSILLDQISDLQQFDVLIDKIANFVFELNTITQAQTQQSIESTNDLCNCSQCHNKSHCEYKNITANHQH
jgi:hypothetical protein